MKKHDLPFVLRVWEGETGPWYISASVGTPEKIHSHDLCRYCHATRKAAQTAVEILYSLARIK